MRRGFGQRAIEEVETEAGYLGEYRIALSQGGFFWRVSRKYADLYECHRQLREEAEAEVQAQKAQVSAKVQAQRTSTQAQAPAAQVMLRCVNCVQSIL